jgi:hypothetical protein
VLWKLFEEFFGIKFSLLGLSYILVLCSVSLLSSFPSSIYMDKPPLCVSITASLENYLLSFYHT